MAAIPLNPDLAAKIVAEWRTGAFSQQALADKHKVSKGAVNKLCKGVAQDMTAIVTAGIQYHSGLNQHDDRIVTAVTDAVDEAVKRMEWLNTANFVVAKTIMQKVQKDGKAASYQDLNAASTTLGRTKDNVFGKTPDTIINNTNAQQSITIDQYKLARESVIASI